MRRVVATAGSGSSGAGLDGAVSERWVRYRVACQPLDVTTEDGARVLRLPELRFALSADADGWLLGAPTLSSERPPLELVGRCRQLVDVAAAPIYRDDASCRAAPAHTTRRCRGDDCSYDADPPFELPACEAAIAALRQLATPVLAASHDDRVASLERLQRISRRGGRLWFAEAAAPAGAGCHPMTVRPRRGDTVTLRAAYRDADGGEVAYDAELELAPLDHTARFASESGTSGGGGWGIGPYTTGLYLGRAGVLLGGRWLSFDRAACAPAP